MEYEEKVTKYSGIAPRAGTSPGDAAPVVEKITDNGYPVRVICAGYQPCLLRAQLNSRGRAGRLVRVARMYRTDVVACVSPCF